MHIKQTRLYGSIKKYRLKQKAIIFISAATAMASAYAATAQSPSKTETAVESFTFSKADARLVSKKFYIADPKGGIPTPQRELNITQNDTRKQILPFLPSQKRPIADGVTAPEYAAN